MTLDLTSPRSHLHRLGVEAGEAELVPMSRGSFSASVFLDHRIVTAASRTSRVACRELVSRRDEIREASRRTCFVFHTAFCGSTLLTQCFDRPGACLPYREPLALAHACMAKPGLLAGDGVSPEPRGAEDWAGLFEVTVGMLSRSFDRDEACLIKPNEVCNVLIPELLDSGSASETRAIFLYSALRSFLCSTLKSEARREWVRQKIKGWASMSETLPALSGVDAKRLEDAEAAAYLWIWQVSNYLRVVGSDGHGARIRALDCEDFFDEPEQTLVAVADFLRLDLSRDDARRIADGDLFRSYSKSGASGGMLGGALRRLGLARRPRFGKDDRDRELRTTASRIADELETGLAWAAALASRHGIPRSLPQPLLDQAGPCAE